MKSKTRIIFRADGNSQIGLGHVVRSLALAEMLCKNFECIFAIQAPSKEIQQQIKGTCDGLIILPACSPDEDRFVHELEAYIADDVIVVLDGYSFDTNYQQHIKQKGALLCCLDDIHAYRFVADVVLNQAGNVQAANYDVAAYTKLLLGPAYALLRPPFLKAAKSKRVFTEKRTHILLSLGGADPQNHTLSIAKQLEGIQHIDKIEIVIGAAYKHLPELQSWLLDKTRIALHQNLESEAMCSLMKKCPIAVTSASGVAYEYAAVGGLLFILQTADNQTGLYDFLIQNGIASKLEQLSGKLKATPLASFKEKVSIQRQYFDGDSDERLRHIFSDLALATNIKLREATQDDLTLLYNWANDPEVRKNSFNPNPILLESHTRWLNSKLEDDNAKLYIAESNGMSVAHIRFELENSKATISYLIGDGYRGKGLGHVILNKGIAELLKNNKGLSQIEGLVQKENMASVRAFEKAGFTNGTPDPNYPHAHRFILRTDKFKQAHQ